MDVNVIGSIQKANNIGFDPSYHQCLIIDKNIAIDLETYNIVWLTFISCELIITDFMV